MLSVFIFKSNARGMQYGMGTYIRELTEALLVHTDFKIYIVTYHCGECKEFTIETISPRYFKINIPSPRQPSSQNNLYDKRYASTVVNLLYDVIPKNEEVVFQINYIDGLPIIKKLKEEYTHPVISVVHFAQWQELFNGNKQKLQGLNIDTPSNNIEYTLSIEKEMYQLSDQIISVTHYMKDFLVNEYGIDSHKIIIVPNGINYSKYKAIFHEEKLKIRRDFGFMPDEKIILFSGRVDPPKGIFFLIDAFMETCNHADNLRLVIAGQGHFQECMQKYQSFYGKITYTGFLHQDKLQQLMQIADIGIAPSLYDHCPYAILEMMANKIPLILSEINGLNEILNEEQCVFIKPIIEPDGEICFDKIELANKILSLIKDENAQAQIAEQAFFRLISKFNSGSMGKKLLKIYTKCSKNNSGNNYGHIIAAEAETRKFKAII